MIADTRVIADIVPVDLPVNMMIAIAWARANASKAGSVKFSGNGSVLQVDSADQAVRQGSPSVGLVLASASTSGVSVDSFTPSAHSLEDPVGPRLDSSTASHGDLSGVIAGSLVATP
jgi:hypothetical protein